MIRKESGHRLFKKIFLFDFKKNWFFFKLKYPKILLLIACTLLAYQIFSNSSVQNYFSNFDKFSYGGIFIAGWLYSFGFTAPFAVGYFLIVEPTNIFTAALVGGFGSVLSDLMIFGFIRLSFEDEFRRLNHENLVRAIKRYLHELLDGSKFLVRASKVFLFSVAILIIGSPLPDEIGVSILAGLSKIRAHTMAVISIVMSTFGIYVILAIS